MLEIKIREQVIQVSDQDSYEMDGGKGVIKLAKLEALADQFKEKVPDPKLLYAFDNGQGLCTAFSCAGLNKESRSCFAIGEAAPNNLDGDIANAFPTIMAANRARVRWITQALGLSGTIYSDIEFATSMEPVPMDEATMKSLKITFGKKYPGKTLGELMETNDGRDYVGWVADNFQAKNVGQKMLVEAANSLLEMYYSESEKVTTEEVN